MKNCHKKHKITLFEPKDGSFCTEYRRESEFGIEYQQWFSEQSLVDSGLSKKTVEALQSSDHIYKKDGALWFKTTDFGDDLDRVVVRENGMHTYFASDIAYHLEKFERGYDKIINIWGSDHHGYIARVKASIAALGHDPKKLEILLVQFANLYRGGEKVAMSTRSGSFVTLEELRNEVGNDAARFFYILRKSEQHMDFDLELAKSESKDNPVYYIQYAHARICTLINKLAEQKMAWDQTMGLSQLEKLSEASEITLMQQIELYPEVLAHAASNHEPHQVAHYLKDLASHFHSYYNAHRMVIEDEQLRNARMCLCMAARQVMANGLNLLGVDAPEHM